MSLIDSFNHLARRIPAWPAYPLSFAYVGWLIWQGATGGLGVEPVVALQRALGEVALYLLMAGLAVTPARRHLGLNLLKFRRAIGLSCFIFVVAHFLAWAVLDLQSLGRVWAEIVKRPYITVGMAGFALLIPLALTSNNWSIRRLGRRWRQLHRLTYAAAILGAVHYLMLVKGFQIRPLIFLAVILLLLALRLRPATLRARFQRG
ncbi:protein-methionine-sulfoxide reductase heme-binding subunit MsrQ [Roseovarius sp. C7]|uniref:protein-methionine-sulfoxide reductase heme-binding subunit MsrQ n=1 Tax=Roseovarius sp. C7 TaxID=3398643 RepID=UPI0039F6AE04